MKKTFVTLFLAAGLFVFFTGTAQADSLMLTGSDFIVGQPNNSGTNCYIGWEVFNYTGADYRYFFAPVHLPTGAKVTSVVVYYEDDSTGYINIQMERRNMYSLVTQDMANWNTTGDMSGVQNHKISPIMYWTINNEGYTYWMSLWFSDPNASVDLMIYGVKINYNAPAS